MDYLCDICGQKVPGDALIFIGHSESHIVDVIKEKHPDWIEKVLADVESLLESDYGKVLTEEQKESFRDFAKEYL